MEEELARSRLGALLAALQAVEVPAEAVAESLAGDLGGWRAVTLLELWRAVCRLRLLRQQAHAQRGRLMPSLPHERAWLRWRTTLSAGAAGVPACRRPVSETKIRRAWIVVPFKISAVPSTNSSSHSTRPLYTSVTPLRT